MSTGETRVATLRVSIPANEAPAYFGLSLFAASTNGNFSISTTMVLNITATYGASFSFDDSSVIWLPGVTDSVDVSVVNTGSYLVEHVWSLQIDSGDCSANLDTLSTTTAVAATALVSFDILPLPSTHSGDTCDLSLHGTVASDNSVSYAYSFTITVGENWSLDMVPDTDLTLTAGVEKTVNVLLINNGSEEDTLLLNAAELSGFSVVMPTPTAVARDSNTYVQMTITADAGLVGPFSLLLNLSSSSSAGQMVHAQIDFIVLEEDGLSLTPPLGERISVNPSESAESSVIIVNTGTSTLSLLPTITGLPQGVDAQLDTTAVSVGVGQSVPFNFTIQVAANVVQSNHDITITLSGRGVSDSVIIDLQIGERLGVLVASSSQQVIASPMAERVHTISVTNLGTSNQSFVLELDSTNTASYFDISISDLSVLLSAGESVNIDLTIRETASGASAGGESLTITVTSAADSQVMDSLEIDIVPHLANMLITVLPTVDEALPGESIHGSVIVTNIGNSLDTLTITTVGIDCGLIESISLAASASSAPLPWSCLIPDDSVASLQELTFRATSSARTDKVVEEGEVYKILASWSNSGIVTVEMDRDADTIAISDDVTFDVKVCNQANAAIDGRLELEGQNTARFEQNWRNVGSDDVIQTYSLPAGACQEFVLLLFTTGSDGFAAELNIRAVSSIEGSTVNDESSTFTITATEAAKPPTGLALPLGFELDNQSGITAISSGWIVALLLLIVMRMTKKKRVLVGPFEELEIEPATSADVPALDSLLGPNEVRMDEERKINCPKCDEKLGVPRGAEAPFRFTCPSCDGKIRVTD
jgi:hypothetical protein